MKMRCRRTFFALAMALLLASLMVIGAQPASAQRPYGARRMYTARPFYAQRVQAAHPPHPQNHPPNHPPSQAQGSGRAPEWQSGVGMRIIRIRLAGAGISRRSIPHPTLIILPRMLPVPARTGPRMLTAM